MPGKYQGKEKTSILQAPNKKELNTLIRSSRSYAKKNGMERFKVLERGKDPDGGYRAVVSAHNWNPITWVKSKIGSAASKAAASAQLEEDRVEKEERKRLREEERAAGRAHKESVRQTSIRSTRERELEEARATPSQKMEARIEKASQKKRYRELRPTVATRLGRGISKVVHGVKEEVTTTYGKGGRVRSRRVKAKVSRGGLSSLMPRGGITTKAPSFSYSGGGLFDVSSMRQLTLPGRSAASMFPGIQRSTPQVQKLPKLSASQSAVYSAVQEGSRDTEALKVATGLSQPAITRALEALRRKGLIKGG